MKYYIIISCWSKFLLTLNILICFYCIQGITQDFTPILGSNSYWKIREFHDFEESSLVYFLKRDTIINSKLYKIIGSYSKHYDCAIREDSSGHVFVVYLNRLNTYIGNQSTLDCYSAYDNSMHSRYGTDSMEYLLYDFNLLTGDTFQVFFPWCTPPSDGGHYNFIATSVDSILINDNYYKQITLESEAIGNYEYYEWIEGVGSTFGPIFTETTPYFEHGFNLICHKSDAGIIYGDCYNSVLEISNQAIASISPNPLIVEASLTIKAPLETKNKIEIFDSKGNVYKIFQTEANSYTLRREDFESGIYYIKIVSKSNLQGIKFIVL